MNSTPSSPPPPPTRNNSGAIQEAALRERMLRANAQGRESTLLGGSTGGPTQKATLLGGGG